MHLQIDAGMEEELDWQLVFDVKNRIKLETSRLPSNKFVMVMVMSAQPQRTTNALATGIIHNVCMCFF